MIVVVDASIAVKWFIRERDSELAERLLPTAHTLVAPGLMRLEVANSLLRAARRDQLTFEEARTAVQRLAAPVIHFHGSLRHLPAALDIAGRHGGTVYDAIYVGLALSITGALVTDDVELAATARAAKVTVVLLNSPDFAALV